MPDSVPDPAVPAAARAPADPGVRDTDADVLIVGYGPVGQLLAVLIARLGWRVVVVERWPQPYPMPRAVAFDGECARILALAGLGDHITAVGEPSGDYQWRTAGGEELLYIGATEPYGAEGWPDSTSMYQPGLEAALAARGAQLPGLRVLRGLEAVELDLETAADRVRLVARDPRGERHALTARWIVGCDGANSFLRTSVAAPSTDFGFSHDWLICDAAVEDHRAYTPNNLQICDPARPRTAVSAGPGHRRWEFMLMPGETRQEMDTDESAWRMLDLFGVAPGEVKLERHAVYAFQARCADRWRTGRVLLAGDAAHLMPPFAGQGMSSGFRDAANLSWKLDLVLRGAARESVLDSYAVERRAHVQHAIGMSVNLGRVICQTDPAAAADRDAVMIAARKRNLGSPASPFRSLTGGLLGGAVKRAAGRLTPQPRVRRGAGPAARFDEVVGYGFALVATGDPRELLDPAQLAWLEALGTRLVHLVAPGAVPDPTDPYAVVDVDGRYGAFLAECGAAAVLVRPDFYAFGAVADEAALGGLVDELRAGLDAPVPVP